MDPIANMILDMGYMGKSHQSWILAEFAGERQRILSLFQTLHTFQAFHRPDPCPSPSDATFSAQHSTSARLGARMQSNIAPDEAAPSIQKNCDRLLTAIVKVLTRGATLPLLCFFSFSVASALYLSHCITSGVLLIAKLLNVSLCILIMHVLLYE